MRRTPLLLTIALALNVTFAADPTLQSLQNQINDLQQRLDEAEERADEIEFEATLSKVKFGLEFSNSISNFNISNGNGTTNHNNGKFATELHLNMNAQINDRTKFSGRLSVMRGWGDMGWSKLLMEISTGRTADGGPIVFLERAYVDYMILNGLHATIGRQPATDGPGSNLRNNSGRLSTYPALLVNLLGDALIFTYAPTYFDASQLTFRAGYSKFYQWVEGSGSSEHFTGTQKDSDGDLMFVEVEGKLPLGAFGDNLAILSYIQTINYSAPINTPTLSLGPVNMGDIQVVNLHFENNKMLGLPFSWFVSGSYFNAKADNGDDAARKVASANGISIETRAQLDSMVAQSGGNASLQQLQAAADRLKLNNESAFAIHAGARVDLPLDFKIGYEYFHGSRYWYAFSRPSIHDPLDFRNTRGDVHDIYLIYQLDFNQFLRASYTNIHNKYSNNGLAFGGADPVDRTAEIFMLMYNLKF